MAINKNARVYDLLREGEIVRQQQAGPVDPVVEARNMMSQTILSHVLLALSDCGFYEFMTERKSTTVQEASKELALDATTLEHLLAYLVGWGAFDYSDGVFTPNEKGKRFMNSYTRGILNIYLGAYKSVLENLSEVLAGRMTIHEEELERSTWHAAAGTAFTTCSFTIPKVIEAIKRFDSKCVLDLGCGTGDFLIQLARLQPDLRGIGVDMSRDALDQARVSTKSFELENRLDFCEAEVGKRDLPISHEQTKAVDLITSMYMLHELGRAGRGAIVNMIKALQSQFKGKKLLLIEVEDFDPLKPTGNPLTHFGRLDYRLIHYLSAQGLPRPQKDWHAIFEEAGCKTIEPGLRAGGSFIYVIEL